MKFYSLAIGEWFTYNNNIYLRMEGHIFNCIQFSSNGNFIKAELLPGYVEVTPVNVDLKIQ